MRAPQAEKRLTQVTKMNDILGSIFKDLDPKNAQKDGKPLSAVLGERLDRATAEIEGEATGDSLAVARMQMTLGSSQLGLGYPDRAIPLFTKARATFGAELGPDHSETLKCMGNLASSYAQAGHYDRAMKLREETLALSEVETRARSSRYGLQHERPRHQLYQRRPERPGDEAPRGDAGASRCRSSARTTPT